MYLLIVLQQSGEILGEPQPEREQAMLYIELKLKISGLWNCLMQLSTPWTFGAIQICFKKVKKIVFTENNMHLIYKS